MADKNTSIDITKTGPNSYRELQKANQAPFTDLSSNYQAFSSIIGKQFAPTSLYDAYNNSEQLVQSPLSKSSTPWGESMFDDKTANEDEFQRLGDIRAENQPWYSKVGAGLGKGVLLTGTTFLDGVIGLPIGLATGIYNAATGDVGTWRDRFLGGFWDNDFSKAMKAINDTSEEIMPNYYTQYEQEHPLSADAIFSANFLGDKLLKNAGFMIGAFYSGMVGTGALKAAKIPQLIGAITKWAKAPAMVASGVGASLSAINEARIEAINNSNDWYNLQKTQIDDRHKERLEEGLAKIKEEYLNNANKTYVRGSDGQRTDAAYLKMQQQLKDFHKNEQAIYDKTLAKIEADRIKMGNADMVMNLPVLLVSNMFQFAKLYANGFKTGRKAVNIVNRAGKFVAPGNKLYAVAGAIKGASWEGTEEALQQGASNISGNYYATDVNNYYKALTDPKAAQETLSRTKAFAEGMSETLGDEGTWEQFLVGSISGAFGMPSFRGIKNSQGNYQSPIYFREGAYGEIKDYNENLARAQGIADYLNTRIQDPKFKNYYQSLVRHNKYQNDMNKALEEGNEFDFKNAEHAQLVSDIAMFDNAGRMQDLNDLIDAAFDTSDENLESIVNNTTSIAEDGSKVGPFIDKKGNPMYSTPKGKQEMIDKLTNNKNDLTKTINDYLKIKNDLDASTGQALSDSQLEELTWMKAQLNNWQDRASEMGGEVKTALSNVIGNLDGYYRFAHNAKLEEGKSNKGITQRYKDAEESEKKLKQAIDTLSLLSRVDGKVMARFLSAAPEYTKGIITEINNVDDSVMNTDEKQNVVTKIQDLVKIGEAEKVYNDKLKTYLTHPEQQAADQQRVDEENVKREEEKRTTDLKTKLTEAKTLSDFRTILRETSDEDEGKTRNTVLQSLVDEGNEIAKNYKETNQYYRDVSHVIDNTPAKQGFTAEETNQAILDAKQLLNAQLEGSEDLDSMANPNSVIINNEHAFDDSSEGDAKLSQKRFNNAKFVLQQAMYEVNKNNKFKDRFSDEYKEPAKDEGSTQSDDKDNGNEVTAAVGDVTTDDLLQENQAINEKVSEPSSQQIDKPEFYRPAIPELGIDASREGDFRNFNEVTNDASKGVNFDYIFNYLRDNGAFSYVNEGNLHVGDEIKFMIDPDYNNPNYPSSQPIFMVTKDGQIVGSLDESQKSLDRFRGLKNLQRRVRDAYAEYLKTLPKGTKPKRFTAPFTTKVAQLLVGKIPYGKEEKSLSQIDGVLGGKQAPVFGIIKNGRLDTNGTVADDKIIKPVDMSNKEGRLYLLIPNGAGKYSPAAVRVKHFNGKEFNILTSNTDNTVDTEKNVIARDLKAAFTKLANARSGEAVREAMGELAPLLYTRDILATYSDENGGELIFSRKLRNPDGSFKKETTKDGKERIAKEDTHIYLSERNTTKDFNTIYNNVVKAFYNYNLPIQVAVGQINDSGYNNRLINSDVLTSNILAATTQSNWFITDYFDNEGNLQKATPLASVAPRTGRKIETPVGGAEGVSLGIPITSVYTKQTYWVDVSNNKIYTKDANGNIVSVPVTDKNKILFDLAQAQNTYGDAANGTAMIDNKVLLSDNRVLDRTKQKYLEGAEAQEVIDALKKRNQSSQDKTDKADEVGSKIAENQRRVDLNSSSSRGFRILEDDGEYHNYKTDLGGLTESGVVSTYTVDNIISQLLSSDDLSNITKPDNMSSEAYTKLIDIINDIKDSLAQHGERIIATNAVLFHKYADGTRLALKADIITVDRQGNFSIYDIKSLLNTNLQSLSANTNSLSLQLSAKKHLFENQYGVPVIKLGVMPFGVTYTGNGIAEVTRVKGMPITYNPAVNVPLVRAVENTSTSSQTKQPNLAFPILNANTVSQKTENTLTDDYHIDTNNEQPGVFDIGGKIHKGYLTPLGTINSVPLYLTKIPNTTTNSDKNKEYVFSNDFYVVFPNGKTFRIVQNNPVAKTDDNGFLTLDQIKEEALDALGKKPQKVKDFATENTSIYERGINGYTLDYSDTKTSVENNSVTPATLNQKEGLTGAKLTAQKVAAANKKNASRTRHKLREATTERQVWDKAKELNWISEVLPQLNEGDRLRFTNGLIRVGNQGTTAWGMFDNGIITLSNIAAEGTAYHEAFHAVFNVLMDNNDRASLLNEYRRKNPGRDNISLEEDLAEDFREFVMQGGKDTRSLGRKIIDFFKSLFIKTKYWKNFRPSSVYYFRAINNGKYANQEYNVPTLAQMRARGEAYTTEMQSILKNAPRDNEGRLLAPNGKVSNLNERQYAQVRTRAFKEWFGDWENDPKNASKVVDENGEPLVVYHSGNPNITAFNQDETISIEKGEEWVTGKGLTEYENEGYTFTDEDRENYNKGKTITISRPNSPYFSSNKHVSESYVEYRGAEGLEERILAGKTYPVFLNIRNVALIDGKEKDWNNISFRGSKVSTRDLEKRFRNTKDGVTIKNIYDLGAPGYARHKDNLSDIFIVYDSANIKSATANIGTFSAENSDIRYRTTDISELSKELDTEYKKASEKINRLNNNRYDTENKALRAFRQSGINQSLFRGLTRNGAKGAAGYKIMLLTKEQFRRYKNDIIERARDKARVEQPFDNLDPDIQMELLNRGWSKETFDRMSQKERDHAIDCIAF